MTQPDNPESTVGSSVPPEPAVPEAKSKRLARLICWAARLTSLPIFALLLVSLVPAVANFAVSARDDRTMAIGLCGVAVGFLLAWRWPGIGGLLTLASVGLIVTQEDGALASDPFSVAFGLQGILFLVSSVLNASRSKPETAAAGLWLKRAAAVVLVAGVFLGAAIILRGPAPIPVAREQEAYLGVWENGKGFKIEITSDGRARITEDKDAKVEPCNSPVKPGESVEFLVEFRDDRLELSRGVVGEVKAYHIDRRPFPQAKRITMVLNGSDPYQRTNGMVLLKQQPAEAKSEKPAPKTRRS